MNVIKQDWTVNNITEEQKKLAEENHNLIYRFLSKYNLSIDEYYDIAAIGLCKAAMTFDESKSKFSTYAFKCMYMIMLHEKRKEKWQKAIPKDKLMYAQAEFENDNGSDTNSFFNLIPSDIDIERDVTLKDTIKKAFESLNERDRNVVRLLINGYKQREVVKIAGCSQPHISRIKKKFKQLMRE